MPKEDSFALVELRDCNSALVLSYETDREGTYSNWGALCSDLLVRSIWKQSRDNACGMLINDRFYHARALDWNFGFGKYAIKATHPVDDSMDWIRYRKKLQQERTSDTGKQ